MQEKVIVIRELKIEDEERLDVYFTGGKLTCKFSKGELAYAYLTSDRKPKIDALASDDYNWHFNFSLE